MCEELRDNRTPTPTLINIVLRKSAALNSGSGQNIL
jgi:hypothetical protein